MTNTPGLLPYPEPTAFVRNGSLDIKALALAADKSAAIMQRITAQALTTGSWADVGFSSVQGRVGDITTSTAAAAITVTYAGIYQISFGATFNLPPAPSGVRAARVTVAGAASQPQLQQSIIPNGTTSPAVSGAGMLQVGAGTTFGLQVYADVASQTLTWAGLSVALYAKL